MIFVQFVPPVSDSGWMDWVDRCREATRQLLEKGPPYKIRASVYGEKKSDILAAYHNKCAFCEVSLIENQHGDVEHFRPKLAVTDENDDPIFMAKVAPKRKHPGYYWLAYEPDNLLPSCVLCNQPSNARGTARLGKRNRFPVERAHIDSENMGIGDLDAAERPLLIHPGREDPADYIEFEPNTGRLVAIDKKGEEGKKKGEMTIAVLGLNREGLPDARKRAYDSVQAQILALTDPRSHRAPIRPEIGKYIVELRRHKEGMAPFSLAGRTALRDSRLLLERLSSRVPSEPGP